MADASQWKVELEAEGEAWKAKQDAHAEQTAVHVDEIAELYTLVGEAPSGNPSSFDTARDCPTAGSGTAYTATFTPAFTSLVNGIELKVRWHTDSGADPTLNIDGLGAKAIKQPNGTAPPVGSLKATYTGKVIYNASLDCWVLVSNVPVSLAGYATEAYATAAAAAVATVEYTRRATGGTHSFNGHAKWAWVEVIGAGGGGGKPGSGGIVGIPGAGGGYCGKLIDLSAGGGISSATVTVGSGGSGGTSTNGGNGGSSSYSDGTNTLTANGGAGGAGHSTNGAEGSSIGGSASGGDINVTGSNGVNKHTRFCGGGAAYGANAAPGYGAGTHPGAGGGTNYTPGNGYDGFRGEIRIWEWF